MVYNFLTMNDKKFTISVFTENTIGLLHRVTTVFTRRKINIESLTVSETETQGVSRFTIVVNGNYDKIAQVVKQIEKQVEVLKCFFYEDEQIVYQELALYKMPTKVFAHSEAVEDIIRESNARVLAIEPEFIVIEKTGREHETQALFKKLEPFGILSFVRSGRVAIAKPMKRLQTHLEELESVSLFE
jgi:acetolactate synthase-1/3 small subunit